MLEKSNYKPYKPGDMWRTRRHLTALCAQDGKMKYVPYNTLVMFLAEAYCNYEESVKFLYQGKVYYAENVDISHVFSFEEEFNDE